MGLSTGRSLAVLGLVLSAGLLAALSAPQVSADQSSELRQQITNAGMRLWTGPRIPLDETLRGSNREKVSLQRLLGKPLLAYNYAEW